MTSWKESLGKVNRKAAEALADPTQYENLFVGLKEAFKGEQYLKTVKKTYPASAYPDVPVRNLSAKDLLSPRVSQF